MTSNKVKPSVSWGVVKTSCFFTRIIYSIWVYTFVCRHWTESQPKIKVGQKETKTRGDSEGSSVYGGGGCHVPTAWKQTWTYSVKNIYSLTYTFIFRVNTKQCLISSPLRGYPGYTGLQRRHRPPLHLPAHTCVKDPDQCWPRTTGLKLNYRVILVRFYCHSSADKNVMAPWNQELQQSVWGWRAFLTFTQAEWRLTRFCMTDIQ